MPATAKTHAETTHRRETTDEGKQQNCSGNELAMLVLRKHGPNQPHLMKPCDLVLEDQALPIFCPFLRVWLNSDVEKGRLVQNGKGRRRKIQNRGGGRFHLYCLKMGLT